MNNTVWSDILLDSMCLYLAKKRGDFKSDNDIVSEFYLFLQKKILPLERQIKKSKEFNKSFMVLKRSEKEQVKAVIRNIKTGADLSPYQSNLNQARPLDLLPLRLGDISFTPCKISRENKFINILLLYKNHSISYRHQTTQKFFC